MGGENTSGQGPTAIVPPEIQGWSWGGFFLNWIWAAVHKAWLGFGLSIIPCTSVIGMIFCGIKGNEWAWQNNRYDSVAHFKEIQAKWTKWGIIIFVGSILLAIVINVVAGIIVAAAGGIQGM